MTGQRELAVQIAEQSRASVLALLAALDDEQEFVDLAALAIGAASARAWTLADLGLASTLGALPLGLIAPGKVADLVVLRQDPLADIRNTLAIEQVMSRGRMLSPDSIRARW